MRRTFFLLFVIPMLVACGNQTKDELVPEGPTNRAKGRLGGAPWTFSSAIARATSTGFDITVAGMGEQISCNSQFPAQAHLSFKAPAQIGRYEFDLANPGSGSAPVFSVFPYNGGSDVVISRQSVVEIRAVSGGIVSGGLSAESSQSGSRGGSVSGSFEAVVCSPDAVRPVPVENGLRQLEQLEGVWTGDASVTKGDANNSRLVQFRIHSRDEGSRRLVSFTLEDRYSLERYWQAEIFANEEGFSQFCIPPGSSRPELRNVGLHQPSTRSFSVRLKDADCSDSNRTLSFRQIESGELSLSSSIYAANRSQNRHVQASRMVRD